MDLLKPISFCFDPSSRLSPHGYTSIRFLPEILPTKLQPSAHAALGWLRWEHRNHQKETEKKNVESSQSSFYINIIGWTSLQGRFYPIFSHCVKFSSIGHGRLNVRGGDHFSKSHFSGCLSGNLQGVWQFLSVERSFLFPFPSPIPTACSFVWQLASVGPRRS